MLHRTVVALLALSLAALAVAACTSGHSAEGEGARQYSGVLGATEFVVGQNRFPFGLVDVDGRELAGASVQVQFYALTQEEPQIKAQAAAQWREVTGVTRHIHDDGQADLHLDVRGVYVVDEVTFDEPGFWRASFLAQDGDGAQPTVQGLAFEVTEGWSGRKVGELVPPTRNLTIHDVASFADISTRAVEDEMHEYSVAQALERREPFVVLFATPVFCVSRMCGPVTDMAAAVHDRHRDRVPFIHIEPYDLTAARTEGRLVLNDAMREWDLLTEPWLFVVGADGRVAARFEGLVAAEELERELQAALAAAG